MATIKMRQGDSFPILVELTQDGEALAPALVSDVEIHVGEELRRTYSGGDLWFDEGEQKWWFLPTQEETHALEPGQYTVEARVKYLDDTVQGIQLGRVTVDDGISEEVL